jgi:predicted nucleic acid-binding protein
MSAQAQIRGLALAIIDGLVAATAIHHDLTIVPRNVTRNVRDFAMWGVPVVNPWES